MTRVIAPHRLAAKAIAKFAVSDNDPEKLGEWLLQLFFEGTRQQIITDFRLNPKASAWSREAALEVCRRYRYVPPAPESPDVLGGATLIMDGLRFDAAWWRHRDLAVVFSVYDHGRLVRTVRNFQLSLPIYWSSW